MRSLPVTGGHGGGATRRTRLAILAGESSKCGQLATGQDGTADANTPCMRDYTLEDVVTDNSLATKDQVRQAKWATRGSGRTWLEQLVVLGILDENRLGDCAVQSLRVPRCDLDRLADIPRAVLARIPADLAAEHRVIPLWLEADGDLRVAMADPTDQVGLHEIQFFAGCGVLRELAPPTAIAWALHRYHGIQSVLWPRQERKLALALVVDATNDSYASYDVDVNVPEPVVEEPWTLTLHTLRHAASAA